MKKAFLFFFLLLFFISACNSKTNEKTIITIDNTKANPGSSFLVMNGAEICTENGKPIIRKFATTWCPHCKWIKETYEEVLNDYEGEIVAYLWELDTGDNALTPEVETAVPRIEKAILTKFNPKNSIPTFIFGCKYYRIGNAFEEQNNLAAEKAEFEAIIEKLLKETKEITLPESKEEEPESKEEPEKKSEVKTFSITAKKWKFSPNTITVKKGDTVKLTIESIDVKHSLTIPAYDIDARLSPGTIETVEFVATKPGTFEFFCDIFCGAGHSGMKGTLIVEE